MGDEPRDRFVDEVTGAVVEGDNDRGLAARGRASGEMFSRVVQGEDLVVPGEVGELGIEEVAGQVDGDGRPPPDAVVDEDDETVTRGVHDVGQARRPLHELPGVSAHQVAMMASSR
jgi:hypothetical protein